MFRSIRQQLEKSIHQSVSKLDGVDGSLDVQIEIPADKKFGEFSCNIAMKLTKILRRNPLQIAEEIKTGLFDQFKQDGIDSLFKQIDIVKPGFINFYLSQSAYYSILQDVLSKGSVFGQNDFGAGLKYMIEFVSANPTGPLTVAHARQAVVGDVLVNILNFCGFDAKREYYVNDGGNQINILGLSVRMRAKELLGEPIEFPEDCYQGEYIKDMAQMFIDQQAITSASQIDSLEDQARHFGKDYLLDVIKKDLEDFGVHFDTWTFESEVATLDTIKQTLQELEDKGLVYEQDGARWFKSTQFGDDKDRVVQKTDGAYTYLTPDIVYHKNKYDRGFDRLVDILGPDHHGYIGRIKAAAQALGRDVEALEVLIIQLASLFRDGQPLSMSTRRGEFISLREVMDDVGVDAARYFFLMRQVSQQLEFDIELAKKQSNDNPVYYIQYAHARVCSILRKAEKEVGITPTQEKFSRIEEDVELDLIKKLGCFSEALIQCSKQLEPFGLVRYLQELAVCFHKFYDVCHVLDKDQTLASDRLALVQASRIVFANGLKLLGVSAPEQM